LNRLRAEEIAASGDLKTVLYNGKAVYIQHVDEHSDVARVYYLDSPNEEFEVSLDHLKEL